MENWYTELAQKLAESLNAQQEQKNCVLCGSVDKIVESISQQLPQLNKKYFTELFIIERNKYPLLLGLLTTPEYLSQV